MGVTSRKTSPEHLHQALVNPGGEQTKRARAAPGKVCRVGGRCGGAGMVGGTGSPWELGQSGIPAAIRTHQEDVKAA